MISNISFSGAGKITELNRKLATRKDFVTKADTFEKTKTEPKREQEPIQSYKEFSEWAKKSDFFNRKNITSKLVSSTPLSKSYEIDGTDKWVVTKYNNAGVIPASHKKSVVTEIKDVLPNLNIGQTIARVERPLNERYSELLFIQKRQNGHNIGVPADRAYLYKKEDEAAYLRSLKEVADMPQKAYDNLVSNMVKILSMGYDVDSINYDAIKVNPYNKEFEITKVSEFSEFNNFSHPKDEAAIGQQYTDMFLNLIGGIYAIHYNEDKSNANKPSYKQVNMNTARIYYKYISALGHKGCCFQGTKDLKKLLNTGMLDEAFFPTSAQTRMADFKRSAKN